MKRENARLKQKVVCKETKYVYEPTNQEEKGKVLRIIAFHSIEKEWFAGNDNRWHKLIDYKPAKKVVKKGGV